MTFPAITASKHTDTKKKVAPIVSVEEQARRKQQRERLHPKEPPEYVIGNGRTFRTGRLLGVGGFAKVYDATVLHDTQPNRCYALKVVRETFEQKKLKEKFESELQIHERMHHPFIVRFYEHFGFLDSHYVVLEHCSNGSLMEMVRQRRALTESEVRLFSIQMAGAIKYMHQRNVIHRDLKMGNILLDHHMNIKIADFGLAALLMEKEERKMTCCGTPNYIAPEILNKSKDGHDFSADLWSLGVIMFALLAGSPPFQSKTTEEMYARIRAKDYTWPQQPRHPIGIQARSLVGALLVEPDKRSSLDEVIRHDFFSTGWMPREASLSWRYSAPQWDANESRDPLPSQLSRLSRQNYEHACETAGVGFNSQGRKRAFVGARRRLHVLEEIVEDEGTAATIPPKPARPLRLPAENFEALGIGQARIPTLAERNEELKRSIGVAAMIEWTDADLIETEMQHRKLREVNPKVLLPIRSRQLPTGYGIEETNKENMKKPTVSLESTYQPPPPMKELIQAQTYRSRVGKPKSVATLTSQAYSTFVPAVDRYHHAAGLMPPTDVRQMRPPAVNPAFTQASRRIVIKPSADAHGQLQAAAGVKPVMDNLFLRAPAREQLSSATTTNRSDVVGFQPPTTVPSHLLPTNSRARTLSKPSEQIPISAPTMTKPTQLQTRKTDRSMITKQKNLLRLMDGVGKADNTSIRWSILARPERSNGIRLWVDYTQRSGLGYVLEDGSLGFLHNNGSGIVLHGSNLKNAWNFQPDSPENDLTFFNLQPLEGAGSRNLEGGSKDVEGQKRALVQLLSKSRDRMITDRSKKAQAEQSQGSEGIGSPAREKTHEKPMRIAQKATDNRHHIESYQRLGDVRVFGFSNGKVQINFPDHTKLIVHEDGLQCSLFGFPASVAYVLRRTESRTRAQADELRRRFWVQVSPRDGRLASGDPSPAPDDLAQDDRSSSPAALMARANGLKGRLAFTIELTRNWYLGDEGMCGDPVESLAWTGKRLVDESQRWIRIGRRP